VILQFGSSRFLQAHVDLFAWQARTSGQDVPPIVIAQVTDDEARSRRLSAFADPSGFSVIVRGVEKGRRIEKPIIVRSVVDGISARRDWRKLVALFVSSVTHVVSNTGAIGFDSIDVERPPTPDQPPNGFIGMIVQLLYNRWKAGRDGVTFLPCELVRTNGAVLHHRVKALSNQWGYGAAFEEWLDTECRWVDTLVDRIVSEPLNPAGAITEPYALWAVSRQPGLVMPFNHPAIELTDDLEHFERLKLHILNLGHTWLAAQWRRLGEPPAMTVLDAMSTPALADSLTAVYRDEVVPGFIARGAGDAAHDYVETTLERFRNPFLAHRLADIATDHSTKIKTRIGGFVDWVERSGTMLPMPKLQHLLQARSAS